MTEVTVAEPDAKDQRTEPAPNAREPYERPTIEKFPPMSNVTFGSNIQPITATVLVP